MSRIARLASRLEEPLLVTGLVNVRYLTGLESSNAAVLVDPSGDATLYTDFRYAEAASEMAGPSGPHADHGESLLDHLTEAGQGLLESFSLGG